MALHFVVDAAADARVGDRVVLTGAEAHHAATVRRVREGEQITLGDGRGAWLTAECESVAPHEVAVRVIARDDLPAPTSRIVLVQALAKGDRGELAVQAATELGVDEIIPWQAARSVSRWEGAKKTKGRARWQAIAREAAKQAHRAWIPEVAEVATTRQLLTRAEASRLVVLEPSGAERLSAVDLAGEGEIVLIVGPEGGIAPEELTTFADAGAVIAVLGDTVLRTSTAGPAAMAVVSTRLGRW